MWSWIEDVPTTNLRIVVSIGLSALYVLVMTVGLVLEKHIDLEVSVTLGGFLLTMGGLDVTQYIQKRKTHIPGEAPDPPTTADVPPVPPAAPVPDAAPPPPKASLTTIIRDD
ncbi:MAG TPA: hypothetical protein VL333_13210 [Candidatus Saccharimonadales bacterium]|jgi:hypothetical protein|nr:hypothetical protein [Candidatus Saccharimonadales bacterium]